MKRFAILLLLIPALSANAQVYNMGFDTWSKTRGCWNPYPKQATSEQRVWDSANHALALLGINGTTPEYEHVAVAGAGKAAAKIESRKVLWAFVAGNIFIGSFVRIVNFAGAEMDMGIPFTGRPARFAGYYHYIPGTVDYVKPPYENMKGNPDVGRIELLLTDWDAPYNIVTNNQHFPDWTTDPHVIGRAVIELETGTDGYVAFDVPIEYRSSKTPSYLSITGAASRYGEYFTGSSNSVLYIDEFRLY